MSVLKSKRGPSRLEFLHTAYVLRRKLVLLMLRDFGIKDKIRNPDFYARIHKMAEEDREKFLEITEKYNIRNILDEYPEWLINELRSRITSESRYLIRNIIQANSLYPTTESELADRRRYQTQAIGCCEQLLQEMQFVMTVIDVDVNKYLPYVDLIEKEIALLRAWRKNDTSRLGKKVAELEAKREVDFERRKNKAKQEYIAKLKAEEKETKKNSKRKEKVSIPPEASEENTPKKSYAEEYITNYISEEALEPYRVLPSSFVDNSSNPSTDDKMYEIIVLQ